MKEWLYEIMKWIQPIYKHIPRVFFQVVILNLRHIFPQKQCRERHLVPRIPTKAI